MQTVGVKRAISSTSSHNITKSTSMNACIILVGGEAASQSLCVTPLLHSMLEFWSARGKHSSDTLSENECVIRSMFRPGKMDENVPIYAERRKAKLTGRHARSLKSHDGLRPLSKNSDVLSFPEMRSISLCKETVCPSRL